MLYHSYSVYGSALSFLFPDSLCTVNIMYKWVQCCILSVTILFLSEKCTNLSISPFELQWNLFPIQVIAKLLLKCFSENYLFQLLISPEKHCQKFNLQPIVLGRWPLQRTKLNCSDKSPFLVNSNWHFPLEWTNQAFCTWKYPLFLSRYPAICILSRPSHYRQ